MYTRGMPTCWPSWHPRYVGLSNKPISSGCATVDGNVQCAPADMAARAGVSLVVYTLARYAQSEVGSGTIEERVAVMEAAVNQARLRGYPDVTKLLVWNPGTKAANQGYYGPIHGPSGVSTAPYGRWAATSKDPSPQTLALAELVASGRSGNFAKGATSQYGMEYLSDPAGKVRSHAEDGKFWVGPLPGVDHMHTFLFRQYPKNSLSTIEVTALRQRGLDAIAAGRPTWKIDCVDGDGGLPGLQAGSVPLIAGIILVGSVALAGAIYLGRMKAHQAAGLPA